MGTVRRVGHLLASCAASCAARCVAPAACALAGAVAGTVLVATAGPATAAGHSWPGHPGRRLVTHTVRPGETATGLAVRYHAWTDELLALNHLGRRATLYVGERIRIPVVLAALRHHGHRHHHLRRHGHRRHHHLRHHVRVHARHRSPRHHHHSRWRHDRMSRSQVARRIAAEARRQGVSPTLAQAIGWQESGWQQHVVSGAGAIGVMQLLPGTGRWMEAYTGGPLDLRDTWDNVRAGVVLIHVLQRSTRDTRHAIGAYYEGLGGVRRHGLSPETRRYVRDVQAIRRRLESGRLP